MATEYGIYSRRTKHLVIRNLDYDEMMCALDDCHCAYRFQDGDVGVQHYGSNWTSMETGDVVLPYTPNDVQYP